MNTPTSLSSIKSKPSGLNRITKVVIALALVGGVFVGSVTALRILGLLNPFLYIPTGSMAPTVSPGDHVVLENFTFLKRKPHRGDIVVFKTDGIASLQPALIYDKRIIGEPGEHLRISDGKIYINDSQIIITNSKGDINFTLSEQMKPFVHYDDVTIPHGEYFVIGDNTTNSLDSRSFGCLPEENIKGRIYFCLWPPKHFGGIK